MIRVEHGLRVRTRFRCRIKLLLKARLGLRNGEHNIVAVDGLEWSKGG